MIRAGKPSAIAGFAVLAALGMMLSACSGTDVEINAPILEAAGVNLMGKKKELEDIPDRPGLVIPPNTASLPEPGSHTQTAANASWPVDPDQQKKQNEQKTAAALEKYCKEGDWSGKGGIDAFNKTVGQERRCRPEWLKNAVKDEDAEKREREAAIKSQANQPQTQQPGSGYSSY